MKDEIKPCFNCGPGMTVPVIVAGQVTPSSSAPQAAAAATASTRVLQAMKWGLVPASWTSADGKAPDHFMMFNARAESLEEKPSFRHLVGSKRCIVLCNGYFEWAKPGQRVLADSPGEQAFTVPRDGPKQPVYVHPARSFASLAPCDPAGSPDCAPAEPIMAMAALWENHPTVGMTCTIVTTAAPDHMAWLHGRVPLWLDAEQARAWLDTAEYPNLDAFEASPNPAVARMLAAAALPSCAHRAVHTTMNSLKFQGHETLTPPDRTHGSARITSFFTSASGHKRSRPTALGEEEEAGQSAAAEPDAGVVVVVSD